MLDFKHFKVSEIGEEIATKWNMLDSSAPDECIYSSIEWVKTTSKSDKVDQNFLMVFDDERLLGGVLYDIVDERFPPHYKIEPFLNGYSPFHKNIPSTGVEIISDSKSLTITDRGAKSCDIRFDPNLTDTQRNKLFTDIMLYLQKYAQKIGCRFLNFMYLPENSYYSSISALLEDNNFNKMLVGASYSLPISFKSFNDYLAKFSSNRRRNIKREINRAEHLGAKYEFLPLQGNELELAKFAGMNFLKYDYDNFNVEAYAERLRYISSNFGTQSYVCVMKIEEEVIGEALLLTYNGILLARTIGIKEGSENVFAYFNLGYYTLIKHALNKGYKNIIYSDGLGETKMSRGCEQEKLYIFSYSILGENLEKQFQTINKYMEGIDELKEKE